MSRSPGNLYERPNSRAPEPAELQRHLPLYRAANKGDWQKAKDHIDNNRDAVTAGITIYNDTALHIAASEGHVKFVKELVTVMTPEQLELQNFDGETALQGAVLAGNIESVKAMVEKNPKLTLIPDRYQYIPLLNAANCTSSKEQKKDIVKYLYSITSTNHDDDPDIFSGDSGRQIICSVIGAGFHDIAEDMIEMYPNLAIEFDSRTRNPCALEMMAVSNAFLRRDELQLWDRLIYSLYFPSTTPGISFTGDMENPPESSSFPFSTRVYQWVSGEIRKLAKHIVPGTTVHTRKLMHEDAISLTKCIITNINCLIDSSDIEEYFTETRILDVATKLGAVEVVMECLKTFPGLHWVKMGKSERDMFYSAVCARQEKIFNLVYQIPGFKKKLAASVDKQGSTILHMVAWTQNSSPFVSSVYCVALRLQRDLQWFKEVESLLPPAHKITRNSGQKTAQELFKEEHTSLFVEGEKWIKDTAQSCAFVSALIATVVFAAAFTNKGNPIFLNENSFIVFAVANALALFSSTSSLLSFVALLTSQYDHADFLESLPKKLMLGLLTLFISIISMMVAFCATLFIVLGPRLLWLPIFLSVIASVPIFLFLWSHILLFVTMFRRTYGPSIFHG
ncbi:hypothetical protein MKW92_015860 [Papaver armeniacum]|nr:hypothetical protein MKW92_015860 [Papaver armeniacum]